MATIQRFEDLEAWQKARELAKEVYKSSAQGKFAKDFDLRNQINRSCGSVMDNIAEGFGRGGRNEFANFLSIAKGSADETKSQLYRALDKGYMSQQDFEKLYSLAVECGNKVGGLIQYLNKSNYTGPKFKGRTTPNKKP